MNQKTSNSLDHMLDGAFSALKLSAGVNAQVEQEKLKTASKVMPSLLLGNLFLTSVCAVTIDVPEITAMRSALLVICLVITSLALVVSTVTNHRRLTEPENKHWKPGSRHFVYLAAALLLGGIWSTVPLALPLLETKMQVVSAVGSLAAVFCVAGFVLAPMPRYAIAFMGPILVSTYATLAFQPSMQTLVMGLALTLYIAFIGVTAVSHTRSMVRVVVAGSEVAKQQKTISLLLRDFEKHSSDWLWEIDSDNRFIHVFDRFAEVSGRNVEQLAGMMIKELFVGEQAKHPAVDILLGSIERRVSFTDLQVPLEVRGDLHWWSLTGTPDLDENGNFSGYHGVGSDITLQKKADERINFLAHHDALTGLYNRAHFTEILNQNVSRLERYGAPFALVFLDLDHFKAVNDTFGHPVGDRLLTEVSNRLRQEIPAGSSIARLGGDEFAVIIPKSVNTDDMASLGRALLQSISAPYLIDGEKLKIGVSIGIAIAPRHGTRPDQLLRNVDLALYRAKEGGRNAYRIFESGMDSVARERRALEFDLRTALEAGELELFYQPLMGSIDSQPVGFEALLRWNHPIRGRISPAEFVPIAESTGLIKTIGEWALKDACRTAATWPSHLTVAVNLSAPQFDRDRIVEVVAMALAESGLDPQRLELEITESLLIDRPDEVLATLQRLKDLGVSIAMDDFGTGYSSLSYLLKFPFDKIKIDKSFISAINTDKAACDVLRTIGSLGKSLNVRITAEGVETEEQAEFLRAIACDQLQGFFFAKPLQMSDIPAFLAKRTAMLLRDAAEPETKNQKAA